MQQSDGRPHDCGLYTRSEERELPGESLDNVWQSESEFAALNNAPSADSPRVYSHG